MNNLDPIIKKNSQWLQNQGVDNTLIKHLQKNSHLRHMVRSERGGSIKAVPSNPIVIERNTSKAKRPYDALDEFSKLATSADFKPILSQDEIAEFACSHSSVLEILTDFSNRRQQEAVKAFLAAASKMDPEKQKIFLKQNTFELYLEGKLNLNTIENDSATKLRTRITRASYDRIHEERAIEFNHIVKHIQAKNCPEEDYRNTASNALPSYVPNNKPAFIFNSDYSEVRIYKKGYSKGSLMLLDKVKISSYDAMRLKQNPYDKTLLKSILEPLERQYSSAKSLSIIGIVGDKEKSTSIDYYNTAQKLLRNDAINQDKAGKFQKDGTLAFVFNSDQTEVRIFRKSGNRNAPIELCSIEKVPPGMQSLQEITETLEKEYGNLQPERNLKRNEKNYHYNTGMTNSKNFLGEALLNFEQANWPYQRNRHRDETFRNLREAIDSVDSQQQLDHLSMIYSDMRDAKNSPLEKGFGARKKRREIEQHFKDRELQLLRKQVKGLNSIEKITSFKNRVETDKKFSGIKKRSNIFSSFMRSFRKNRDRQTEQDKLIEDIEQLESIQKGYNELNSRLRALKHVYNSSKVSGLERIQYKLAEQSMEQLEKDIQQLEMKHREFLLKGGDKNENDINLQDYKNLNADLNKFKTDYKELVNSLNTPIKEDNNKVNQIPKTRLTDNGNTFKFTDDSHTEKGNPTEISPLNITHHN